jgi:hypothetical protein
MLGVPRLVDVSDSTYRIAGADGTPARVVLKR